MVDTFLGDFLKIRRVPVPGGVGGGERPHMDHNQDISFNRVYLLDERRRRDALGSKFYHVSAK
jgi:hypothetical protein